MTTRRRANAATTMANGERHRLRIMLREPAAVSFIVCAYFPISGARFGTLLHAGSSVRPSNVELEDVCGASKLGRTAGLRLNTLFTIPLNPTPNRTAMNWQDNYTKNNARAEPRCIIKGVRAKVQPSPA